MSDPSPSQLHPAIYRHSGLLGTVIEVRVARTAGGGAIPDECNELVIDEIERLQSVFSAYDPASEFSRWRRGRLETISPELSDLLALALSWQERSGGGFNPLAGELSDRWRLAESEGVVPPDADLAAITERIRQPRFSMIGGHPIPNGDCSAMSLNAIAKGYIVERAMDRAAERLETTAFDWWLSVNAGGDLAHRGSGFLRVGIENPHRPYDNEPPLTTIALSGAALATSGFARRGFRVGEQWFGHVLDPHSGRPVDAIASISVVGSDAATADVVATAAGVMAPAAALAFLDALDGVEGMIVDHDRHQLQTRGWRALVLF